MTRRTLYALCVLAFVSGTAFGPLSFWVRTPVMVAAFYVILRDVGPRGWTRTE